MACLTLPSCLPCLRVLALQPVLSDKAATTCALPCACRPQPKRSLLLCCRPPGCLCWCCLVRQANIREHRAAKPADLHAALARLSGKQIPADCCQDCAGPRTSVRRPSITPVCFYMYMSCCSEDATKGAARLLSKITKSFGTVVTRRTRYKRVWTGRWPAQLLATQSADARRH